MNKNIRVTEHFAGNDWGGKTTWSVANFAKMHERTIVEYVPKVGPETEAYYLDRPGCKSVKIEETGLPFNAKYRITMILDVPEITNFKYESKAREFARTL